MAREEMPREKAIKMLEYVKHTGNGENEYKNCAQEIAINMGIKGIKQMDALDKIRAEISELKGTFPKEYYLAIIDKHREETTDGSSN